MSTADALWAVIDPDDYRTVDAALDHLRASLSEGLCPFCAQTLDPFTEAGSSYLVCMGCVSGFPAFTPKQSTESLRPAQRKEVAETLLHMKGGLS